MTDDELDEVLATVPEYVGNMAEAEAEMAAGVKGITLDEAFGSLGEP